MPSTTSVGSQLTSNKPITLQSQAAHLINTHGQTPLFAIETIGVTTIEPGRSTHVATSSTSRSDALWQSHKSHQEQHIRHTLPPLGEETRIRSTGLNLTLPQGRSLNLTGQPAGAIVQTVADHHESTHHRIQGPTATLAVIASIGGAAAGGIGAAAMTAGMSSAVGAAAIGGAMGAMGGQAAAGLLQNQGDPFATLEGMTSREALQSTAMAAATAGATRGILGAADISLNPSTVPEYVAHGMAHAAAHTVSSVVIRGTSIDEALREGVIAGAVDAVAHYGANRIGEAYGEGALNIVTHKVAHGVLGAGIAAAQGRTDTHEILGGAAGGMLGEIIAESLTDIPSLTRSAADATAHVPAADLPSAIAAHTREQLRPTNVISRMAAVGIAGALGGDPHLAAQTAQNAVEHNNLKLAQELIKAGINGVRFLKEKGFYYGRVGLNYIRILGSNNRRAPASELIEVTEDTAAAGEQSVTTAPPPSPGAGRVEIPRNRSLVVVKEQNPPACWGWTNFSLASTTGWGRWPSCRGFRS